MNGLSDEAIAALADSISRIAHGNDHGPGGLEALTIAVKEGQDRIASATGDIGDAIRQHSDDMSEAIHAMASAIEKLADAIANSK